jgi:hypothetical protein
VAVTPVAVRATPAAFPSGLFLLGLGLAGGIAIRLLGLDALPFPLCTFKAMTGLPCPGCGATRALGCLARLDLVGALAMNPLAATFALAVIPWAVADVALMLRRQAAVTIELAPSAMPVVRTTLVAAIGAQWLYLLMAGR